MQDVGYAPIAAGAGSYLPPLSNHSAQAHLVAAQDATTPMHKDGSGSHTPIQAQLVVLGEEHVGFVKSVIARHTEHEQSMCRLCKSRGTTRGMAPANVGPQLCTCKHIQAEDVAKALVPRLSNAHRVVMSFDDVVDFVRDTAKSGFDVTKGTFFTPHGKYVTSRAEGGKHNVDFHPHNGQPQKIGQFGSAGHARHQIMEHTKKLAQGSANTVRIKKPAADPDASKRFTMPHLKLKSLDGDALDGQLKELHAEEDIEKSLRWSHKHPGHATTTHGKYVVSEHEDETGAKHHMVTYTPKGGDKAYTKKFKTHREALGATVEHHLKNRPPPKPRKKRDPNAPKAPKGSRPGGCPPCP